MWDTVGALGVPIPIPFWRPWWAFHDTELSKIVNNAYHGIAINEHRWPYKPTIWTRDSEPPNQHLEQVWFAGVHRDVGGSYLEPDLADITLKWMIGRPRKCELTFDPSHFQVDADAGDESRYEGLAINPDPYGLAHESRVGAWNLLPKLMRAIPCGRTSAVPLSGQWVSRTAIARMQAGGYVPRALQTYNGPFADLDSESDQVSEPEAAPQPSDVELADLLRCHTPRLRFDSLESLRPSRIDAYVTQSALMRDAAPQPAAAGLDMLGPPRSERWRLDPLPGQPGLHGPRRSVELLRAYGAEQGLNQAGFCYGRWVTGKDEIFLQYWFFYVDNPFVVDPGRHDGDWEFAQVRLAKTSEAWEATHLTLDQHGLPETHCLPAATVRPEVYVAVGRTPPTSTAEPSLSCRYPTSATVHAGRRILPKCWTSL